MTRMTTRQAQPTRGPTAVVAATIAAVLVAAAAVLALHALRRDLEPASHRLSEYAIGPWGWVMTAAFTAVAAGTWLLRRALPTAASLRPVRTLLTVATIGFVLSAVFPTDPETPEGVRETVHSAASTGALLALTAAALWTVTTGARAIRWRGAHGRAGTAVAVATLGLVISPVVHDSPWTGAVQRLTCLALAVWLVLLCRAVDRADRAARAPAGSYDPP